MNLPEATAFTFLGECVSTMDEVHERLDEQSEGTLVIVGADHQTGGRGRSGNTWIDQGPGTSVLVTGGIDARIEQGEVAGLDGIIAALLCRGLVGEWGELDGKLRVKAPNDVVADAGKLAGVLVSARTFRDHVSRLLISIGLNVSEAPDGDDLDDDATACCLTDLVSGKVDGDRVSEIVTELIADELAALRG